MPAISSYEFGRMAVDSKVHTSDLIIFPDGRVQGSWWRKNGHCLCLEDIADLVASKPDIIICGTGAYGVMTPDKNLVAHLTDKGIDFVADKTGGAVSLYNQECGRKKVGACFHLTC